MELIILIAPSSTRHNRWYHSDVIDVTLITKVTDLLYFIKLQQHRIIKYFLVDKHTKNEV